MEMKYNLVPRKFRKNLFAKTIVLGFLAGNYLLAGSAIAANNVHVTKYLNPYSTSLNIFDVNDCVKADPQCLLTTAGSIFSETGVTAYQLSQTCDADQARALYATPIEDQIKSGHIVGREFCKGIVSISDMDLPFTKDAGVKDANDGMLLIDAVRHNLAEVNHHLNNMMRIADQGASGTYSSTQLGTLNNEFQAEMAAVSKITASAYFNGIALLEGGHQDISTKAGTLAIAFSNMSTGSEGLGISTLSTDTSANSQMAMSGITTALTTVDMAYEQLKKDNAKLKTAAKHDANTTYVDMRTIPYTITHK